MPSSRPQPPLLTADELRDLAALATRVRGHAGESIGTATSQRVGRGFELHGHDPYRPGDDARAIDWRARIRTGELWVRRHKAEGDGGVRIVVDDSASMTEGKRRLAARLAAALAVAAGAASLPVAIDGLPGAGQGGAERARLDPLGAPRALARLGHLGGQGRVGAIDHVHAGHPPGQPRGARRRAGGGHLGSRRPRAARRAGGVDHAGRRHQRGRGRGRRQPFGRAARAGQHHLVGLGQPGPDRVEVAGPGRRQIDHQDARSAALAAQRPGRGQPEQPDRDHQQPARPPGAAVAPPAGTAGRDQEPQRVHDGAAGRAPGQPQRRDQRQQEREPTRDR